MEILPVGRMKSRMPGWHRHEALWGLLFVAPAVIYFSVFWIYPLLHAFWTSFTIWDLFSPPKFVGIQNYLALLEDREFHQAAKVTLYYALGTVLPIPILSLGLALLLNRGFRGRNLFSAAFLVPAIMSWIAAAIVWKLVYMPNAGLYLLLAEPLGIYEIRWLTSTTLAMPAIIIFAIWKSVGYNMLLFLAGLQSMPEELHEAARVDGANSWQVLFAITLPLLKPTSLFVMVMLLIGAVQVFTPVYVMTRGGPANATRVLPLFLYEEAFSFYKMGSASAVSIVMFVTLLGLTVLQLQLFGGEADD